MVGQKLAENWVCYSAFSSAQGCRQETVHRGTEAAYKDQVNQPYDPWLLSRRVFKDPLAHHPPHRLLSRLPVQTDLVSGPTEQTKKATQIYRGTSAKLKLISGLLVDRCCFFSGLRRLRAPDQIMLGKSNSTSSHPLSSPSASFSQLGIAMPSIVPVEPRNIENKCRRRALRVCGMLGKLESPQPIRIGILLSFAVLSQAPITQSNYEHERRNVALPNSGLVFDDELEVYRRTLTRF